MSGSISESRLQSGLKLMNNEYFYVIGMELRA